MKFEKYPKLNNVQGSSALKFREVIKRLPQYSGTWYVSEKVHGANFSIIYDGESFKTGKRSGWIGSRESFNNSGQVLEDNKEFIKNIYNDILKNNPKTKFITVFGEIFGGSYPHPSVKIEEHNYRAVQQEIKYSPKIMFYAFDIYRFDNHSKPIGLSVPECEELFKNSGIFYAKTLFKGPLNECMLFSNEFKTTIPGLLGLPDLEDLSNICEGTVIKPEEYCHVGNERVVFKNKNHNWKEVSPNKKINIKNIDEDLSEKEREVLSNWSQYLTKNRLLNVMSKMNDKDKTHFGTLLQHLREDAFEDFANDFPLDAVFFKDMPKNRKKCVKKIIGMDCESLVREELFGMK